MPNQRDIARVLGVNQATVSLALRGDRSVSEKVRQRVRETADRLGYRQNAYVSTLMAHIRSGRRPSEEGVIALVVEARSEAEWHAVESYRIYQGGAEARAAELGFRLEPFFLREPGMSPALVDRILEARGIPGLILAPPYRGNRSLAMRWERYACVGMGHGWEPQEFDRVANDHAQNMILTFENLERLGYRRIGVLLGGLAAVAGKGLKWLPGFLEAQSRLPARRRVPLFSGDPESDALPAWVERFRPDALVTVTEWGRTLIERLGRRMPEDLALACLVRPREGGFAGVDEKNDVLGGAAVELVAAKIARNETGLPAHPRLTLIDGRWVDGLSAPGRFSHRDERMRSCAPCPSVSRSV